MKQGNCDMEFSAQESKCEIFEKNCPETSIFIPLAMTNFRPDKLILN